MNSSKRNVFASWFAVLIALVWMALADASCAQAQIKVGVFGPMSGDAAAYGTSERNTVELAAKEQNAAGGLIGQQVEPKYGDDGGKPEQAVSVAKRLTTEDGVVILLGSISSPASLRRDPGRRRHRDSANRRGRYRAHHHGSGQPVGVPLGRARHQTCR